MNIGIKPKLSAYQWLGVSLLSINFWYSGMVLISSVSYYLGFTVTVFLILSVLSYPFANISIRGVEWIMGLTPTTSKGAVIIITVVVSLLHCVALFLIPDWYDVTGFALFLASGWLGIFSLTVIATSYSRRKSI